MFIDDTCAEILTRALLGFLRHRLIMAEVMECLEHGGLVLIKPRLIEARFPVCQ